MSIKSSPQDLLEQHKKRLFRLKNHPLLIPVVTLITLIIITLVATVAFGGTTVGPADSRIVHVFVNGQEQTLPTRAATVNSLLDRLNIKLSEGDVVEPKLKTKILEDGFTINVYRARPVTVIDGKRRISQLSAKQSPDAVARDAGVKLYPEDNVEIRVPDNVVKEGIVGQEFVIRRSVPMNLVLYGQFYKIRTHSKNIAELLQEKNINEDEVTVFPNRATKIKKGSVVFVTYPGKKIISKQVVIKHGTTTVDDPEQPAGFTKVQEPGRNGKKVVLYEVDTNDPKKKKVLKEVIAFAAIDRVVVKGTKVTVTGGKADWMRQAGISSSDYQYVDFVISHESGWNPASVSANRCIGLGQRCNPSVLINDCPGWQHDPVCQLKHFSGYAGRYGGWRGAYSFWQVNHWW
jgi:resuscitation-promoting factor RpfB